MKELTQPCDTCNNDVTLKTAVVICPTCKAILQKAIEEKTMNESLFANIKDDIKEES